MTHGEALYGGAIPTYLTPLHPHPMVTGARVDDALRLWDEMKQNGIALDAVMYNTLIAACAHARPVARVDDVPWDSLFTHTMVAFRRVSSSAIC